MTALPSGEEESGKSRLGPRFGPTTIIGALPEQALGPNPDKLSMGDESIIIGTVDRGEPITQVSREWEIVDMECVIFLVAREESQPRERNIGPGSEEEEWGE